MKKSGFGSRRWLRRKLVALAVASCFAAEVAHANPYGATVINGQVFFNINGNLLQITNSPGSIINWQGFSIAANEITRFIQQSASSAVLNRVTGVDPSIILGALQSNGRVVLINPNGITFGAGASIDTAGFTASTLGLSDADFLGGRYRFTEVPGAGGIINQGAITTPSGGFVYLVAPDIQNSGIIRSDGGEVILAAGKSVELVNPGSPDLRVQITAPDNQAVNVGQIIAQGGKIGIYGGLVRQGGVVNANSAVMGENGKIVFKATQSVTLDAGSVTTANGPQGGSVTIQSETGTTTVAGTVEAKGAEATGGTVQVLGNRVDLVGQASIDASGQTGGGTILVGGDYQGSNPDVQNAQFTNVESGVTLRADAIQSGNGGRVIAWSDDTTTFHGSISARGGAAGGNGGFAEISGKQHLWLTGFADLRAPIGQDGLLLLDPGQVNVCADNGTTCTIATAGLDTFSDTYISSQLGLGSLSILTSAATGANGANQDIVFLSSGIAISWGNASVFTLTAGRNISLDGSITGNSGTLNLNFGQGVTPGTLTIPSTASLSAGTINATGGAGTDTIAVTRDANFTLSNSSLVISGGPTLNLSSVETANLTGGGSANTFTVSGWTGGGTLDGAGGTDVVAATNDVANFTLTNTTLDRTGTTQLTLTSIETANLTGGGSANTFTVSGWTGGGTLTGGGGADVIAATKNNDFTLTNTSLASSDGMSVTLSAIGTANLTGGAGDNSFTVTGWTGAGTMDGAGGTGDSIVAVNDVDFTLTNTSLARSGGATTLTLANMEVATLTGGGSANTFTVSGWTGGGTLTGGGGADVIAATKNQDFTLTDTSLASSDGMSLTLANIGTANLTGGAAANTFTVSGWTGGGTLDGAGGTDVVAATNNAANFTLTTTTLDRTGTTQLTLTSIETANLTGGGSANTFTVSGWTGGGTLDGAGGTDVVAATNDVANFTLTNTTLDRTGTTQLTLTSIETANLTGGGSANTFTVSGWTGGGTLTGGGGADVIAATKNQDFTLTDTSLASSDGMSLTLANIGTANLTGGAAANTFTVSGWTGGGTLDGAGGTDVVAATNNAANFTLTTTTLDRTGTTQLTLTSIETANLTGGGSANTFTVSGWTGGGTLDGAGGTDVVAATNDAANFTLTNTTLDRTGTTQLTLTSIETANLTGGGSANTFTVSGWTGGGTLTGGGGADVIAATKNNDFTLTNTSLASSDGMSVTLSAIGTANLTGGAGDNSFTVTGWTGAGTMDGAGGTGDSIVAVNDVDFTLTNTSLARSGGATTLTLANMEVATLTGGGSANTFTVSGWTGGGTLTGGGGADVIAATKNQDFTLTDTSLASSDGMSLTLANIGTANLTGGAAANTFTVSGWTGGGTLDGAGGTDVVAATNNAANFTLTTTTLDRTGTTQLTLTSIETANLTGGGSANTFTVSGWTGGGTLDGAGGTDVVAATNDVANFTLTNTTLDRTGTTQLTLTSIETANLTGGGSANTFTVSGWTGGGTLTGGGGADVIAATKNNDFTLTNTSLASSDGMSVTLSAIGTANLTGGAGDNSFTVTGWTGAGTMDGAGGTGDSIVAVNDVDFTLTNTSLARSGGATTLTLANMEVATLTGGGSANTFTVSGWTGGGTLTGGGGADVIAATKNNDFTLTNTSLASSDGMSVTLSAIGTANLTGGAAANTFTVSGWTGGGTLTGGGGADVIAATKNNDFTLTNTSLASSDGMSVTLSAIGTANLTGGGSDNSFTVTGWTGAGTMDGAGGTGDSIVAVNDVDFTLTNTSLARSGGATTLTLANMEVATLTGGGSANMFTVSGWTGGGTLTGGGGADVIAATKNQDFTLTDTSLASSDGMSLTLANIGTANLTGGAAANTFTLSGWTGSGTIAGAGGSDTLIGPNAANTWDVTAANTGNINGTITFTSVENLTGGTSTDDFAFNGGSLTGNLDGGGAAAGNTLAIASGNATIGGTVTNMGSLTVNTAGTADFQGAVTATTVTVTQSSGTTFQNTLTAGTVTLTDTTGTIAFEGDTTVSTAFNTAAQPYNVSFTGGTNSIAGTTTFSNSGALTLGDGGDAITFTGGVTAILPSGVDIGGTVATSNALMDLGAVTLTSASTLDSNGGNIQLASLTGAQDLTLAAGIGGGTTTVTGNVTNLGDGTGAALTIASGVTGLVRFQGTVGANSGLVAAAATSNVRFDGNVTASGGNTGTSLPGAVQLDGLTFTGDSNGITFGATTLSGGPVTLDSAGGNIQLASLTGAQDLTLAAGIGGGTTTVTGNVTNLGDGTGAALTIASGVTGLVRFQGTVGANSGLVAAAATSNVRFDGNVTASGGNTGTSLPGAVQLDGLTFTGDSNGITFGATTLSGGPVTLDSAGGNIQLASLTGAQDLTLAAGIGGGTTTVTGNVTNLGDGTGAALTIASGVTGLVRFQGTVGANSGLVAAAATSNVRFDGNVTASGGNTGTSLPGAVQLDGLTFTGDSNGITFGATTLSGGPVTLDSAGGNIQLASLTGAQDLTLAAGIGGGTTTVTGNVTNLGDGTGAALTIASGVTGLVRFQGTVGANSGLVAAAATSNVRFDGNVTASGGNTGTSLPGAVQLDGLTFTGDSNGITFGATTLSGGPVTLDSAGGNIQLASLTGAQDLTLAAGIGGGTTTVTGNVTNLGDGTGAALTIASGVTGLVRFQGTVGANSGLVAAAATSNVRFDGNVTASGGNTGTSLPGAVQLDGLTFTGDSNGITFGATTLSGGPVTLDSAGGNIQLASLTGAQDLTLAAGIGGGTTTVTGNVTNLGDGTGAALTIASGVTGLVRFQGTVGANSGLVAAAATSNVRFDGNVTASGGNTGTSLPGAVQLDGLTFTGDSNGITFGATTLSGGPVTLDSAGGNIQLASLTGAQDLTLAAGIGGGTTTVTGNVTNLGDGTGAALTIASGVTGLVRFQGTVGANSGLVAAAATSNVRFDGNVTASGGNTGTSLPGAVQLDGLTFTGDSNGITFGATTLSGGPVTLDSAGGNIQLASLTGAQDLTLAAGIGAGTTTVTGNVTNLGDGTGAALTIASGVTGLVRFQGTVGANSGLVAAAATSNVRFDGDVTLADGDTATSLPGTVQLDGLTFSGFDGITFGATTLSGAAVNVTNSNGTDIQLGSIAGGAQDLTLDAGITGNINVVGNATGLNNFTVTSALSSTFGGNLTAAGNISIAADEIDFNGGINSVSTTGGGTLLLQPAGNGVSIDIGSPAGGSGTLDLSDTDLLALANGFSSITIGRAAGAHAINVGSSSFADPLTIRAPAAGGSITISEALSGTGNASITLNAGTGGIDVDSSVTPAGANNLVLTTTGAVRDTAGTGMLDTSGGGNLSVTAASGIGTTTNPLHTTTTTLTADNTTSGNVYILETDSANLATTFRNQGGSLWLETLNGGIDTGTAAVSTSGGQMVLIANDTTGGNTGFITIGSGGVGSLNAGGGDIQLHAADIITIGGTGVTTSGSGNVQMIAGTGPGINMLHASITKPASEGAMDDFGEIILNAPVTTAAGGNTVLIASTTNTSTIINGVTQGLGGRITTGDLTVVTLRGAGGSGQGGATIDLNDANPLNSTTNINLFACSINGCPSSVGGQPFTNAPMIVDLGSPPPTVQYGDGPIFYTDAGGTNVSGVGTVNDFTFYSPVAFSVDGSTLFGRNVTFEANGDIDIDLLSQITNNNISAGGTVKFVSHGSINYNPSAAGNTFGSSGTTFDRSLQFIATDNIDLNNAIYVGATGSLVVSANQPITFTSVPPAPAGIQSASGTGSVTMRGNHEIRVGGNFTLNGQNLTVQGGDVGSANDNAIGQQLNVGGTLDLNLTGDINVTAGTAVAGSDSAAIINGGNVNIGSAGARVTNLTLQGGSNTVNGGGSHSSDATIHSAGALNIFLSGNATLTGGNSTATAAAGTDKSTALAMIDGVSVTLDVLGNVTITGGTASADSGASALITDYGADASAKIISGGGFNPIIGGDLTISGGSSTATAAAGVTAKAKAQGLLQGATLDMTIGGDFNLDNAAATADATNAGIAAQATSSALLSAGGTKKLIVGGDWNMIGGNATVTGADATADTIAGTDPGAASTATLTANVTGAINVTAGFEAGGVDASSAAAMLAGGEIKLFTPGGLTLTGNVGTGLFQQVGAFVTRVNGQFYPVTVNNTGSGITIVQDLTRGDALVLSGAPPQNLDQLQQGILSAIEQSKGNRIVGFLDDKNLEKNKPAPGNVCK